MFEITDAEMYATKVDLQAEMQKQLISGFLQQQNEVFSQILAEHGISDADALQYCTKEDQCGATRIFYKNKPIAIFYKPEIENNGMTIGLKQNYRILKG